MFSTFTYQLLFNYVSVLILFVFHSVIPQLSLLDSKTFCVLLSVAVETTNLNKPGTLSNLIVNDSPNRGRNKLFGNSLEFFNLIQSDNITCCPRQVSNILTHK